MWTNLGMIAHSRPTLSEEEAKAVHDVVLSNYISEGKWVKAFEDSVAKYIGCKYAVVVNSGTSALQLTLLALGVNKGDEVIIPAYTCTGIYYAVKAAGAVPVVVDVSEKNFSPAPKAVMQKITPKTRAIVCVHTFGIAAPLGGLLSLNIPVIEDCAHSVGSSYNGKKIGSFGAASIYSFYATKMMTTGEGGMVLTNSQAVADTVRQIKTADSTKNDKETRFNYKLTDMQAAMGLVQLRKLDDFIKRRRQIAKRYNQAFEDLTGIEVPQRDEEHDTFYRYVIKMPNRETADLFMEKQHMGGVICDRPYERPLYRLLQEKKSKFKNAEDCFDCLVSIPIYPSLSDGEVETVIYRCKTIFQDIL